MCGHVSGEGLKSGPVSSPMFATTQWSVVLNAADASSPSAVTALEQLCRAYWYPLYAFIRRKGHDPDEAKDLTQSFFARLLERDFIQRADPDTGRFRSYLLTALNRFLLDEWKRASRQRRGGGQETISFDAGTAEERYRREPAGPLDAKQLYERRWAMTLLDQVLARLEQEFVALGNAALFAELQVFLLGEKAETSHAGIAVKLGLTEGAVKSAVYRLRRRYRDLLREEIAQTVATTGDVEEELRHLFAVLSG